MGYDYWDAAQHFTSSLDADAIVREMARAISDLGLADCPLVRTLISIGMDIATAAILAKLEPSDEQLARLL